MLYDTSLFRREASLKGTATLLVYNVLGEKIRSYTFPAGKKENSIKTAAFSKGIYFLKMISGSSFSTKLVIVN